MTTSNGEKIRRTEPGTAAITSRQSKYFRAIFRPSDACPQVCFISA